MKRKKQSVSRQRLYKPSAPEAAVPNANVSPVSKTGAEDKGAPKIRVPRSTKRTAKPSKALIIDCENLSPCSLQVTPDMVVTLVGCSSSVEGWRFVLARTNPGLVPERIENRIAHVKDSSDLLAAAVAGRFVASGFKEVLVASLDQAYGVFGASRGAGTIEAIRRVDFPPTKPEMLVTADDLFLYTAEALAGDLVTSLKVAPVLEKLFWAVDGSPLVTEKVADALASVCPGTSWTRLRVSIKLTGASFDGGGLIRKHGNLLLKRDVDRVFSILKGAPPSRLLVGEAIRAAVAPEEFMLVLGGSLKTSSLAAVVSKLVELSAAQVASAGNKTSGVWRPIAPTASSAVGGSRCVVPMARAARVAVPPAPMPTVTKPEAPSELPLEPSSDDLLSAFNALRSPDGGAVNIGFVTALLKSRSQLAAKGSVPNAVILAAGLAPFKPTPDGQRFVAGPEDRLEEPVFDPSVMRAPTTGDFQAAFEVAASPDGGALLAAIWGVLASAGLRRPDDSKVRENLVWRAGFRVRQHPELLGMIERRPLSRVSSMSR